MTILEYADELMRLTKGDGRAAVILALAYASSGGYLRAGRLSPADLVLDDGEPLDASNQQAPHG